MLCALGFFFPSTSCVCLILFLFICEEMHLHLFCVIEEDAGESVQPSVKAGL